MLSSNSWEPKRASKMATNTDNPIRKLVDGMKLVPNPNKEVISLTLGDPTVFGNLPLDSTVEDAVIQSVRSNKRNGYGPSIGYDDAREAVAKIHSIDGLQYVKSDVILANGCSGALDLAISVIADPGDNILVPRPGFSLYQVLAKSLGISVRYYNLLPEKNWEADTMHMDHLIDARTKLILLNNPSNPCGSVWSSKHIAECIAIAEKRKIIIVADEVYADFVFEGKEFKSTASLAKNCPVITCGGLTKKYLVPGWRLGWIIIHDPCGALEQEIRPGLTNLSQRILGPNTLIQGALESILTKTPLSFFTKSISVVQKNAELCFTALSNTKGLQPIMPSGAMYMMVGIEMDKFPGFKSDIDFTEKLVLEESVFCLPAKIFQYPNYFRIVLTVPEEKLKIALDRIYEFCQKHYEPGSSVENIKNKFFFKLDYNANIQ